MSEALVFVAKQMLDPFSLRDRLLSWGILYVVCLTFVEKIRERKRDIGLRKLVDKLCANCGLVIAVSAQRSKK